MSFKTRNVFSVLGILSLLTVFAWKATYICEGFVEENDMRIPVQVHGMMVTSGISEETYNRILDRIDQIYTPIIQKKGGKLQINRDWQNEEVNAFAQRMWNTWQVTFPGGLPRHAAITADGFALVACHEIGHHLGGYPQNSMFNMKWLSIEGQADYFANAKCLREFFTPETNQDFMNNHDIEPFVLEKCQTHFSTKDDVAACVRGTYAGFSVSALFKDLRQEEKEADLRTPDRTVVSEMYKDHPGTQCRLDTYFSGSICEKMKNETFSDDDEHGGACTPKQGFKEGLRPLCWFKPAS